MPRISRKELDRWLKAAQKYAAFVILSKPGRYYELTISPTGYGSIGYTGPLHGVLAVLRAYVWGVETGLRRGR